MFNFILSFLVFFTVNSGIRYGTGEIPVRHVTLELPGWPHQLSGLRLLLISDLHLRSVHFRDGTAERIISKINQTEADYLMLAGDYVNVNSRLRKTDVTPQELDSFIRKLNPRRGIFAVTGNHDQRLPENAVSRILEANKVKLLSGRIFRISGSGASFFLASGRHRYYKQSAYSRRLARLAGTAPVIILDHSPDVLDLLPDNISLLICGHTHGGQINLPFFHSLALHPPYFLKHRSGLHRDGGRYVYVSPGIGCGHVDVRIGAEPELAVLTLQTEITAGK